MKLSAPAPTSGAATLVMRGNRKFNTQPERRLRSYLHRQGFRFRVHFEVRANGVRVRPDIVFPRSRLAVMVDGCFWHACPAHGTRPTSNREYWNLKLARNLARDRRVDTALNEEGWFVLRIWEHIAIEEAGSMVRSALDMKGLVRTDVR
jgi:DNA mismatch endonuclease (patch repair protein)